ncbi:putative mediator of RNA polymerase II transcription subunit 26c [Apostasia shenzhenica]|uniref:Putative mediator of RNA polymerase II transcription subunit 26c n=1 Tax=Apostasia shenzhenica TaxID=1088818 RepID=A0A2I0B168_9ASPA|nr:putative mediator of RNA polymerase II transcription subunit 26c [Apostasia shenzhenica]
MDPEDLRAFLRTAGVDLWSLLETAIAVAAVDHQKELKARRDGIVERLYAPAEGRCQNCEGGRVSGRSKGSSSPMSRRQWSASPATPPSMLREEDDLRGEKGAVEVEQDCRSIDDEQSKVLAIKDFLEDRDQSDDSLVSHLQNLADMDITFKALKETDIGRHVNGLRKHPSSEVRRLVKQLVRKWKETVDKWVKSNSANEISPPAIITDGDSPLQFPSKNNQNGQQSAEFSCSPNPLAHNASLRSERNGSESVEPKARQLLRRETPSKPVNSSSPSTAPAAKDSLLDPERLASARRRLQENYQEAQNAKKQRTIQVMDIHEIPKPKNSFFARNKGGFQAKHW